MRTIWKYPIVAQDYFEIEMPKDAEVLCVQLQHDTPCIWALVDPEKKRETKRFRLAGTGHLIKEENLKYIGTFQLYEGELVFHLFELACKKSGI